MKIEIITIGDEILIGQIVDTNSAWMGKEVNLLGWEIVRITTVPDDSAEIKQAFDSAFTRADIILVTGGTGPTKDDVTKNVLLEYFGGKLIFREDIKDNIEQIFANRNITLNELTLSQAYVPDNATVLMNKAGTAPCTCFEKEGKLLVSMAGVPSEMKWLMSNEVLPMLIKRFGDNAAVIHSTFLVKNYSESALAEKLASLEKELTPEFKLAYLPQPGIVRLRLTGRSSDKSDLEKKTEAFCGKIRSLIGKDIFSEKDLPVEILVGNSLKKLGVSLSTAESCTGGNIAHLITEIAGSSEYFKGSVVAYSNEVKHNVLRVSSESLDLYGAVSEQVVNEMLTGVSSVCKTECAVATSGIAGPGGGSAEKPVGTVWIGAKYRDRYLIRLYKFGNIREYNISKASNMALLMLLELLNE